MNRERLGRERVVRNASMRAALAFPPRTPIRGIVPACCASPGSGASARLRVSTTASPIRRMGTFMGMAGRSLAERH
jgi:hypothetical protein